MASRSFSGRSVVITGAAGGIGRALARRFGRAGARLCLLDIDGPALENVRAEAEAAGVPARAIRCDVTNPEACTAAMTEAERFGGGIDLLINNAGRTHLSTFRATDLSVLRRVLELNFFGAVNCTKAAIEPLVRSKGAVIAISSVAGFAPLTGRAGYAASKHAMHGFFDTLRVELSADGVHVMVVCPSCTNTDIGAHALAGDGTLATNIERSVTGSVLSPDDVADAIFRGASARRRQLVLSRTGKAAYLVSRFAPRLYDRLMHRRMAL